MRWKTTVLLVSAIVLAGFSLLTTPSLAGGKAGDGAKALQGSWTMTKGNDKMTLTFDGDKFKLEFKGESASGTFKVDASKTPGHIDLSVVKGTGDDTQKYEGKTSKGLYQIEGNKLKWFANEPGKNDRPTAFPGDGERPKHLYAIFERDKK